MSIEETKHLENQQSFVNQTFDKHIIEKNLSIDGNVNFKNCVFKMSLVFENINISGSLIFHNCTFYQPTSIKNCSANVISVSGGVIQSKYFELISNQSKFLEIEHLKADEIYINGNHTFVFIINVTAKNILFKDVNTSYPINESKIELTNGTIDKLEFQGTSLHSDILFKRGSYKNIFFQGNFNNAISFDEKIKVEYLFFESSTFSKRIDIKEGDYQYIYLYRSLFKSLVLVNGINLLEKKYNNLKIKNLTIHSNSFEQNVAINLLEMELLNLSDNQFAKTIHLNSYIDDISKFDKNIRFSLNGVNQGNIVVNNTYLDIDLEGINFGNISFKDVKIDSLYINDFQNNGKISFSNIVEGNFFIIQNSTVGKMLFLNANVNSFKEIVIANSNVEGINFSIYPKKIRSYSSNPIFGYGISDKSKNIGNLKHIYNQLKQVAKKNGDIDMANRYQSLEYKQLLLSKKLSWDSILLALNWLSNDNGKSWFRGVLFTLGVTFVFFYLYLTTLQTSLETKINFEDYILFLTSFPKLYLDKFTDANNTWEVNLVIWLSRIFISYGIYQTISAFRKYGRV